MRFASAIAILVTVLLASCSGKGGASDGTSALAKQLVGHWSTASNDHLYFGGIEPGSKTGRYTLVHPDGKAFEHRYEIASEDSGNRTLVLNLKFASGNTDEATYVISADGSSIETTKIITGIETKSQLTKVDEKTEP